MTTSASAPIAGRRFIGGLAGSNGNVSNVLRRARQRQDDRCRHRGRLFRRGSPCLVHPDQAGREPELMARLVCDERRRVPAAGPGGASCRRAGRPNVIIQASTPTDRSLSRTRSIGPLPAAVPTVRLDVSSAGTARDGTALQAGGCGHDLRTKAGFVGERAFSAPPAPRRLAWPGGGLVGKPRARDTCTGPGRGPRSGGGHPGSADWRTREPSLSRDGNVGDTAPDWSAPAAIGDSRTDRQSLRGNAHRDLGNAGGPVAQPRPARHASHLRASTATVIDSKRRLTVGK